MSISVTVRIEQCTYPLWFSNHDTVHVVIASESSSSVMLNWHSRTPFRQVFERECSSCDIVDTSTGAPRVAVSKNGSKEVYQKDSKSQDTDKEEDEEEAFPKRRNLKKRRESI